MRAVINTLAAHATVVMPGLAEGRLLTGASEPDDIAEFYLRRGVPQVVIKLGEAGARGWSVDGRTVHSRSFKVTAIDTVGAGDGFAAGYLAAFLAGGSLQERVDQGAAVGALVTTRRGDLAAMPQRDEVDALINSTPSQPVVPASRYG
jgi:sugar/nucleoside kinase (ribokinase family)